MTTITPIKNRVLIAQNVVEKKTESGIVLTGSGTGNTTPATVLAAGPDAKEVKVGDVVYVNWSKATPVKVDGNDRAMILEDDIIAVVEK